MICLVEVELPFMFQIFLGNIQIQMVNKEIYPTLMGFPGGKVENPAANAAESLCMGKIPWRRAWQPTPVFLPGESPGQRSLAGYNSQDCKELDTTEVNLTHTHTHTLTTLM